MSGGETCVTPACISKGRPGLNTELLVWVSWGLRHQQRHPKKDFAKELRFKNKTPKKTLFLPFMYLLTEALEHRHSAENQRFLRTASEMGSFYQGLVTGCVQSWGEGEGTVPAPEAPWGLAWPHFCTGSLRQGPGLLLGLWASQETGVGSRAPHSSLTAVMPQFHDLSELPPILAHSFPNLPNPPTACVGFLQLPQEKTKNQARWFQTWFWEPGSLKFKIKV